MTSFLAPQAALHHTDRGRRSAVSCPHCGGALRTRSNREVTPLYRQLYLACFDADCGATFAGSLTIEHQVTPSLSPNPAVKLRMAPPRKKPANDNPFAAPEVAAANDDSPLGEAAEA